MIMIESQSSYIFSVLRQYQLKFEAYNFLLLDPFPEEITTFMAITKIVNLSNERRPLIRAVID